MDIRKSIKDVLDKKVSSKLKYDSIIELIDKVPVDETLYDIYIIFLKDSVFYQNSNYLKSLEPAYQKALYVTLMALEIATRMHKKIAYKDRLAFYKANSSIYAGLTAEEFDRNVMNEINGRIGAKVARKLTTQANAQQTAKARQQTTASNGLSGSVFQKFHSNVTLSKVSDNIDKKIESLGIEYRKKIIDGLIILINQTPLKLKIDSIKLKKLGIEEKKVNDLINKLIQVKEQNTNLYQFIKVEKKNREQDSRLDKITGALNILIDSLSNKKSFLDIFIEIGLAFAVPGFIAGAIGAIASNLYKRIKVFNKHTLVIEPHLIGQQLIIKNDFWATNSAKILDEALKDGIKQGLRDRLSVQQIKKYFQEDSKIFFDSFKDEPNPFLSMMFHQFEEVSFLLIVLASLGFLTKYEVDKYYAYFYKRHYTLTNYSNFETYINILIKEQGQVIVKDTLHYTWLVWGYYDESFEKTSRRHRINIQPPYDYDNKEYLNALKVILSLNNKLESFFNEIIFDRSSLYSYIGMGLLPSNASPSSQEITRLITAGTEERSIGDLLNLSFSTKIYRFPIGILGLFLESEVEANIRERHIITKVSFFISFLSHSNIAYYNKKNFPTITNFYNLTSLDQLKKLQTAHFEEQNLLNKLSE